MTNEQKLQYYQKMLELVKKHLDINYEYLTPFGFEVELEKIVEKIDNVDVLKDQINDLKYEIKDLKEKLENK